MARGPVCSHCEEKLAPKQVFCGKCGHPTVNASHDERVLWDLGQWEASRRRTATADPKGSARAAESAARTKELFHSQRGKAADTDTGSRNGVAAQPEPAQQRRSFLGRNGGDEAQPVRPAASAAPPVARLAPRPAPQEPVRQAPAARSAQPSARPNGSAPASRTAAPRQTSVPPARRAMVERPQPARSVEPARRVAPAAGVRTAATAASVAAPERTEIRPEVRPEPAARPSDAPFVVIRKPATKPAAPEAAEAAPTSAPPPRVAAPHAPPKPSRADRKAAEQQRREAERQEKLAREAAERAREEQRKEEERRNLELQKEEERRRKEDAKESKKRERKHRRHAKRVNRRAAELDLRNGERVSLSIEGWSRFRRATLVVTNYRVALITRMPPQVRWIPLEEVSDVHHRWFGAHSLRIVSPIEVMTLQKSKRQMLGSFEELLESEVAEARRPGATERHHGDITQEWAELSTEIWDSHFRRLRLWIRRHPAVTLGTLLVCVAGAFLLSALFTSFFSSYR